MCGISVIISWNLAHLHSIQAMNDMISYRGPDDEGFAFFSLEREKKSLIFGGNNSPQGLFTSDLKYAPRHILTSNTNLNNYSIAFAHRRLSILDLSIYGHQPMCDPSQRYWITFNGEIYNYLELKKELENKGYTFFSNSDTEVILHAYHEWKEECLHHFNGMFAFVIFDNQEHTLFAARDRFAVKPMYYWTSPFGFLAIASEIKQFTVLPGWKSELNMQAAYDFLNWAMTNHEEESIFKGVNQIRGGHFLQCQLEKTKPPHIAPKKWYHIPSKSYTKTLEEAGIEFAALLKDSIEIRCRADVPIGSCLSGGLDSSSIVCLIHSILKQSNFSHPQMTFSFCSEHPEFDEKEYITEVVRNTNVNSHYVSPSVDQLLLDLDKITWHQEQPFGSSSLFAQWSVFELASKAKVKVMLDGQGADEQLAGYPPYLATRLTDLAKQMQLKLLWRELRACRKIHNISFPLKLLLNQMLPNWIRQPIRKALKKTILNPPWLNTTNVNAILRNPHSSEFSVRGDLLNLSYMQMTKTHLPMLLHFEDRNSMAHSLEARNPFLDYRLVEFVLNLPCKFKLDRAISKVVLREGLKRILPQKILSRTTKLSFSTPEEIWIRSQPDLFLSLIKESISSAQGIFNEEITPHLESIIRGKSSYNPFLWRVLIFGRWMNQFQVTYK